MQTPVNIFNIKEQLRFIVKAASIINKFANSEEIFSSLSEKLLERQEIQEMRLEKDIKIT